MRHKRRHVTLIRQAGLKIFLGNLQKIETPGAEWKQGISDPPLLGKAEIAAALGPSLSKINIDGTFLRMDASDEVTPRRITVVGWG